MDEVDLVINLSVNLNKDMQSLIRTLDNSKV
jgi:hypothetical protein